MNKQIIDEMIVKAMDILSANEVKIVENNQVPSEYFGYIASFGPAVVQTGLIQTVAFYCNDSDEGKKRKKIIALMAKTLEQTGRIANLGNSDLYEYLKNQWNNNNFYARIHLKNMVMEACTACKLALRTFPKKDDNNANE